VQNITDTFDVNTTLIPGSVAIQGDMGTCVPGATSHTGSQIGQGNSVGDHNLVATMYGIPPGGTVTVSVNVIVNTGIPTSVEQLQNQAVVTYSMRSSIAGWCVSIL
jgi:hypothetical protein